MKLYWYGHACFRLETAGGSVVFDPYEPGSVPGLALPPLRADAVICSHGHSDHNYAAGVTLSGRTPDFRLTQIPCFHDEKQGALRGTNRITVVEAEGLRVAHLGDLGHPLSPEQQKALGRIDLLMIPVGGYYTIGPEEADWQARAIGARLVVPMHYRGPGFGYPVIGPVEDFLRLRERVVRLDGSELDPSEIEGEATVLLRCPAEG